MTNTTMDLVTALKDNDQDFEWYPTTIDMINVVKRHIAHDATSIMDIGAGDGRVLELLKEKCEHAELYSIEKSPILVQQQSKDIIPIGTDLWEQNLSHLPVDFIFSNPKYSDYEEWTAKIISEGYARRAYLVIPQRWKESKWIDGALKKRGATAEVIHSDDFLAADRKSRAIVDIVVIRFPERVAGYSYRTVKQDIKDPFDIWFDDMIGTFQKPKEIEDEPTGSEIAKKHKNSNITEMVEAYREEYALLESNYKAIFKMDFEVLRELAVNKDTVCTALKKRITGLKIKYWGILFKRLDAITSRLTTSSSKKLIDKLTRRNTVEFTANNAYAVVLWAIKNANQYIEDQIVELFYDLSVFESVFKYKSNQQTWQKNNWRYNRKDEGYTHYRLDYRIVVSCWGGAYYRGHASDYHDQGNLKDRAHEIVSDIIAVMGNLGFNTNGLGSRDRQWKRGQWQDWYDSNWNEIVFQVKAYENGNLHMRFMPEAIQALNIQAARILKWVNSVDEIITEMNYPVDIALKYFNYDHQIPISNAKALMAPKD